MPDQAYTVLVYQFGKVASTSIERTLQDLTNVNAHQTHFLGSQLLHNELELLLDSDLHPRFVEHGLGQLVRNVSLTRLLHSHLQGDIPGRNLVVLTIVREPIDWFRSQFIQEMEAYKGDLVALQGGGRADEEERVIFNGVQKIRQTLKRAIAACGGLSNPGFRDVLHSEFMPTYLDSQRSHARLIAPHLQTFLRPFFWFQDAVEPLFGFGLPDIQLDADGFSQMTFSWGTYLIMRFEDISEGFARVLDHLGAEQTSLVRENISVGKPYSRPILNAFSPWFGDTELRDLCRSQYTSTFGYSGSHDP